MSIDANALLDRLQSHLLATGHFRAVNTHEPKNAPAEGPTAALWLDRIRPLPGQSGLNKTSTVVVFTCRIYQNMVSNPQDAIDPTVIAATSASMGALSGDFDLGATVKAVDLLGSSGIPLEARAGYVEVSGTMFRVVDITIPILINDTWEQA